MNSNKTVVIVGTYDVIEKKRFAYQITEQDMNWNAYIIGNLLCRNKSEYDLWKGYENWNEDLFQFEDTVVSGSMNVQDIYIAKPNELVKFIPGKLSISEQSDPVRSFENLFK
jgi:hypothetical protein